MITAHVWILAPQDVPSVVEACLTEEGWRVVERGGEALRLERGPGERASLSFDPETQLRVLSCDALDDFIERTELQPLDRARLRAWLSAETERIVLRGVRAAERTMDPALTPWVESKRAHPSAAIAEAATRVAAALRARLEAPTADAYFATRAARFGGTEKANPELPDASRLDRGALDFSVQSLDAVDAYLLALHSRATELDEDAFSNAVVRSGAYVGEVIRRHAERELHWMRQAELRLEYPRRPCASAGALLDAGGDGSLPVEATASRVELGAEKSVRAFAEAQLLHARRRPRPAMLEASILDARRRRPRSEERLVVNPKTGFADLRRTLELIDLRLAVAPTEPEPRAATFSDADHVVQYAFDPALGLRTLILRGPEVRALLNDIVNQAYLSTIDDCAALLESSEREELLLGLAAIQFKHGARAARAYEAELAALQEHGDPEIRRLAQALVGQAK